MKSKREVDVVIISDVHLGTYGCHADDHLRYLKSIKPRRIILNGDIIDIWQFSKRYWPKSHMLIIKHIISLLSKGTIIDYIPGNHDEMLRKFVGFSLGNFRITNKVVLKLNGKRAWVFHGDVFDVTMKNSKWLARLGAVGYDSLIIINTSTSSPVKLIFSPPIVTSRLFSCSSFAISKGVNELIAAAISLSFGPYC